MPAVEDLDKKLKAGEKLMRKADREVCYKARDGFWDCMTVSGGLPIFKTFNFISDFKHEHDKYKWWRLFHSS